MDPGRGVSCRTDTHGTGLGRLQLWQPLTAGSSSRPAALKLQLALLQYRLYLTPRPGCEGKRWVGPCYCGSSRSSRSSDYGTVAASGRDVFPGSLIV